mgnify:FL=1
MLLKAELKLNLDLIHKNETGVEKPKFMSTERSERKSNLDTPKDSAGSSTTRLRTLAARAQTLHKNTFSLNITELHSIRNLKTNPVQQDITVQLNYPYSAREETQKSGENYFPVNAEYSSGRLPSNSHENNNRHFGK